MSTKNTPLTLNATYTIEIRDLGVHGEGIGSAENFTVFVPGALPGETVKARIILIKKSYASGKLISVEKPSPYRTVPQCPVYDSCGGCQISHLTYEGQLAAKERRVKDVMVRIGKASEDVVLPILGAPHEWNYRNKMAVPVGQVTGGPVLGYYRQGTHQIVPIQECLIQEEENNRLLRFAEDFMIRHGITGYNEKSGKGCVRHVMGRVGDNGEVMAVIVTATENLPKKDLWAEEIQKALPEVVSLYHDVQNKKRNVILGPEIHHIWGRKTLTASLCGIAFEVSPFSFFQVHKAQAEVLYQKALDAADLKGGETVIDAYCGTGTISLCLAKKHAASSASKSSGKPSKTLRKCRIQPYRKRRIPRRRRRPPHAETLRRRPSPRRHRHGPRQSRMQRRRSQSRRRHATRPHRLRLLQPRHLRPRRRDLGPLRPLQTTVRPARGHVPTDHSRRVRSFNV